MNNPTKEILDKLRSDYPKGTRVELVSMDDPYRKLTEGAKGTVQAVDDMGTIHVSWDCGSSLGIVYGVDQCRKLMKCPKCKQEYSSYPAVSRRDNQTKICPECGLREALEDVGKNNEEVEKTIAEIRELKR